MLFRSLAEALTLSEVGNIDVPLEMLPAHSFELVDEGNLDLGVFVGGTEHCLPNDRGDVPPRAAGSSSHTSLSKLDRHAAGQEVVYQAFLQELELVAVGFFGADARVLDL